MTALNAETGAVEWVRYTIPGPGEDGHDTWSGDVQGLRGVDRRAQHRRGGDARHITVARRHAILHGHGRCTKCDRRGRYRAAAHYDVYREELLEKIFDMSVAWMSEHMPTD